MFYTPEEPGLLTIYLKAINALHAQNVTKHILVQNLLTAAVLYASPLDTFINKTVTLMANVIPRSNPVECLWDFGDGSTSVHTNTTTVGYEYRHPGHYLVQVCFLELHYSMYSMYSYRSIIYLLICKYDAVCESLTSFHHVFLPAR